MPEPDDPLVAVRRLLVEAGLAGEDEPIDITSLSGGVSGETWRARTDRGEFVVKVVLPQLRVAAEWYAPVERAETEAEWFRVAGTIVPDAVPPLMAIVPRHHAIITGFVAAPLWKSEMIAGRVDPAWARAVGERTGAIHRATAGDPAVAARFADHAAFHALRVEPFLLYTAEQHVGLRDLLLALAADLSARREALVHGDVSPKNILLAAAGPVIIDAECAVYGDPAFDPAFCITHLLLKALWLGDHRQSLLASASELVAGYAPSPDIERRIAHLVPALLLARVDGRSPVEYLSDDLRRRVRAAAIDLLHEPRDEMTALIAAWREAIA